MRRQSGWLWLVMVLLTACGAAVAAPLPAVTPLVATAVPATAVMEDGAMLELPDLGAAPEFGNDVWLNSAEPLRVAALQGRVVLLSFWTFGCINCQRTIPNIQAWQAAYVNDDFAIVSIHYPEFGYEEDVDNVAAALERYGITYPVAIDNEGVTWRAYRQRYWPTAYLIDKNGRLRYQHIGEFSRSADAEMAAAIEALLAEPAP